MHIPEEKIEEVRAASDIVDVVSDYVRLKKRGGNFVGLCPFHDEKTPSFNVNPRMQIFKCFGCGVGGDVYQFLMRVDKSLFPETVRALAERANIDIPEPGKATPASSEVEAIHNALRFAARFFHDHLVGSGGARALAYFRDERALNDDSIARFGLGYAPNKWDELSKAARDAHISDETLEKAGLVIARKDRSGYYDRFRDRIIFPIFSRVGKVIGFGGRILRVSDDQPKYINSPETRVYHKARELYGLYHARDAVRRAEEVLLVEGYLDVISLHQAGIANVVASSGTALTKEQVTMLGRYCNKVLLLYDADSAGAGASMRGIDLILEAGMSVYVVSLPEGTDPDSYVRRDGVAAFNEYIESNRVDFVTFKYQMGLDKDDLNTPEGEAAAQREVVASIARIPDPLLRDSYVRRASEVMGVPDIRLHQALERLGRHASRRGPAVTARARAGSPEAEVRPASTWRVPLPEEKTLLRLMMEFGTPIVELVLGNMSLDEFTEGASRTCATILLRQYQAGALDNSKLLDGSAGEEAQALAAEVLVDTDEPSENWSRMQNIEVPPRFADPEEAAIKSMVLLKLDRVDEAIQNQKRKVFAATEQEKQLRETQTEMMRLYETRKEIANRSFLTWNRRDPANEVQAPAD